MTQFIISAIGSYGDVHPMIGLGAALAGRGHRVKLITNPYFADLVHDAGPCWSTASCTIRVPGSPGLDISENTPSGYHSP
jgi:UDP:flavonoid glycosyltransferase YjiC (YdhE family)